MTGRGGSASGGFNEDLRGEKVLDRTQRSRSTQTPTCDRDLLRDRSGNLDNAINFEFELKGLGSAGQDTRRILRRSILGYDRDDLYLIPPSLNTRAGRDSTKNPD